MVVSFATSLTYRLASIEWEQQMKAIIHRMDKQKGPTVYSTGNYILDPVINHNGKNIFKKECIYV